MGRIKELFMLEMQRLHEEEFNEHLQSYNIMNWEYTDKNCSNCDNTVLIKSGDSFFCTKCNSEVKPNNQSNNQLKTN